MKKIFILFAFIFATFALTSCEEYVKEQRAEFENSVLTLERSKLPFVVNDYENNGIAVKSIEIDTVIMVYETDGNIIPSWGYLKTIWELPVTETESNYDYIFNENYSYGIYKKEIFVELSDLDTQNGHVKYSVKWPDNPLIAKNTINQELNTK